MPSFVTTTLQLSENLIVEYRVVLCHDTPGAEEANGFIQGPNSVSLMVLRLDPPTFLSVTW